MEYVKLSYELGKGIAERATIGLIVLATDNTIEHEWRNLMRVPGVAFYESRLFNETNITPDNLRKMERDIAPQTDLIRPGEPIDVVAFGCTSGAMVIGDDKIREQIHKVRPSSEVTSPIAGMLAALKALSATRIAVLTPYIRQLNESLKEFLEKQDLTVVKMGSFELEDDNAVSRIGDDSLKSAIRELATADIDAVFVSCTSLLVTPFIKEMEDELGIPITSSNHAMAWHALRLANVADSMPQHGKLFTTEMI